MSYQIKILRRAQKALGDLRQENYEINDQKKIVTILFIGHRRDIYRSLV